MTCRSSHSKRRRHRSHIGAAQMLDIRLVSFVVVVAMESFSTKARPRTCCQQCECTKRRVKVRESSVAFKSGNNLVHFRFFNFESRRSCGDLGKYALA